MQTCRAEYVLHSTQSGARNSIPGVSRTTPERFVRLERDMHGTIRGSGLGLAITRQLVEAMHGTIRVESSGVAGEGSTFTFTLPTTSTS